MNTRYVRSSISRRGEQPRSISTEEAARLTAQCFKRFTHSVRDNQKLRQFAGQNFAHAFNVNITITIFHHFNFEARSIYARHFCRLSFTEIAEMAN